MDGSRDASNVADVDATGPATMKLVLWYWGRRGGGAQFTARLAEGLLGCGADVLLHLSTDNSEQYHPDLSIVRAPVHHPLGAVHAIAHPTKSIGSTIRRFDADAVIHPMVNPLTTLAWPSVRLIGRRPILTVIHDPAPHPGDEHLLMDLAARHAVRRSDLVVAPSTYVSTALAASTGRNVGAIQLGPLISNQPLVPHTGRSPHADGIDGPLLFAGRLLPYKGLDLLADAWEDFAGRSSVRLRVVGEDTGDPSVQAALAKLESLGAEIERRWLSDAELVNEISSARALVLPYREASQSGLIPLAHSLGVPVIATEVGALKEQIGQGGWISTPHRTSLQSLFQTVAVDRESVARVRFHLAGMKSPSQIWVTVAQQLINQLEPLLHRVDQP